MNIMYLSEAVKKLRLKGFLREAEKIENITQEIKADFVVEDPIEDTLNSYRKIHNMAAVCKCKVITAVIRKENECPFGLPIPIGCKYAGDSVVDMVEGDHPINKKIYNTERTHESCIYNDNLLEEKKAVNCTYGTILQGKKSMKMFHGNPQYPKMWSGFSGIALDRGYHAYSQQYGNELFPYPSIYG